MQLGDRPVVAADHRLVDPAAREVVHQLLDPVLDEEDAGRLQGLDEAARQADRDAVLDPGVAAAADPHLDVVGRQSSAAGPGARGTRPRPHPRRGTGCSRRSPCRPAVERDVPRPAGVHAPSPSCTAPSRWPRMSTGTCRATALSLSSVSSKEMKGSLERLVDQQAAEAGAVDEQVGLDRPVLLGHDAGDAAVLAQGHVDDLVRQPCARRAASSTPRGTRRAGRRRSGRRRGTGPSAPTGTRSGRGHRWRSSPGPCRRTPGRPGTGGSAWRRRAPGS